jgi:hypothetical protein
MPADTADTRANNAWSTRPRYGSRPRSHNTTPRHSPQHSPPTRQPMPRRGIKPFISAR